MSVRVHDDGDWFDLLEGHEDEPAKIVTFSFAGSLGSIKNLLVARRAPTQLVVHERFRASAYLLKTGCPKAELRIARAIHAKIALVGTKLVIVSTGNFGCSGWTEATVCIECEDAFQKLEARIFRPVWARSQVVVNPADGATPRDLQIVLRDLQVQIMRETTTWRLEMGLLEASKHVRRLDGS